MDIKISANLDKSFAPDTIEVIINASSNSTELQNIIENIQKFTNSKNVIIGKKNNKIFMVPINEIIMFYTSENNILCKTSTDEFKIDKKIYELEDSYSNFIRISKSCIINISYIDYFDLKYIGNVIVKLKNGDIQNVAKRRIPKVMKFLNSLNS